MALKFSLVASTVPLTLDESEYELREMTAAVRDSYLDTLGERVKIDAKGQAAGVKKFDGMQADLIARCMFTKAGQAVTKEVIQGWPSSVVGSLFDECQSLNHLTTKAPETKNG